MSPHRTSLTRVLGGPPSYGREDSHISLAMYPLALVLGVTVARRDQAVRP
jgi:hypothetical protein